jgi:hypothetical protein
VSTEAEEPSLLEAVKRKRLVKTLLAGKEFAGVICEVWKSAMMLYYL